MFVRYVMYRISSHRGLPGRYAKILGDVPPKCSRLGLTVSRPPRQVCDDISKFQFAAFQRQVCEVSRNIAANPWFARYVIASRVC
ncbi:hypothetical protein HanPSC8_Chr09g0357091 [Helianthus annuus]|nr:hypothetical protein HanPSC8_Chr09g0357091 [Helianthus annuus]